MQYTQFMLHMWEWTHISWHCRRYGTWLITQCMTKRPNEFCISIQLLASISFTYHLQTFSSSPPTTFSAHKYPPRPINFHEMSIMGQFYFWWHILLITFSTVDWPWRLRNYRLWRICQDHDLTEFFRICKDVYQKKFDNKQPTITKFLVSQLKAVCTFVTILRHYRRHYSP